MLRTTRMCTCARARPPQVVALVDVLAEPELSGVTYLAAAYNDLNDVTFQPLAARLCSSTCAALTGTAVAARARALECKDGPCSGSPPAVSLARSCVR